MLFGEQLLSIRKKKKVSQDELTKQIGVHAPVIGRYERNEVKPSIDVATNIANALGVSLDFLVGITDVDLDNEVLHQVMDIQKLNDEDKKQINSTLNALLRDAKARKAYSK
jgi:transcriptional regulator with XRE-family HTH domain